MLALMVWLDVRMPLIDIVEHRTVWISEFDAIAAALIGALATADDDAAGPILVGVEPVRHIGSSAVPGLVAKDVIDVQVSVIDVGDDRLAQRIEAAGFTWRADIVGDHLPAGMTMDAAQLEKRFAIQGGHPDGTPMRRMNIHFRSPGRFNHRFALLCRDYLRSHPIAAAAYGEVKANLARLFPDDAESYYDVKDPVFDLIMVGAEAWAASVCWTA